MRPCPGRRLPTTCSRRPWFTWKRKGSHLVVWGRRRKNKKSIHPEFFVHAKNFFCSLLFFVMISRRPCPNRRLWTHSRKPWFMWKRRSYLLCGEEEKVRLSKIEKSAHPLLRYLSWIYYLFVVVVVGTNYEQWVEGKVWEDWQKGKLLNVKG